VPRLAHKLPSYRLHKAGGQAVVTLDGTVFYLGLHGSEASRVEFDRLIQQWMRNGSPPGRRGVEQAATGLWRRCGRRAGDGQAPEAAL